MDQTVNQMLHELSLHDLWAISEWFNEIDQNNLAQLDEKDDQLAELVMTEFNRRIELIKSKM